MKRYICLILAVCICFSLFGCGSSSDIKQTTATEPEQTVVTVNQSSKIEEILPETEEITPETEEPDKLSFDPESMYCIYLTATDNMSVRDYDYAVEAVKNRLDILTDGEPYFLETHGDTIEVWLPKSCLHGESVEFVISCYIGCAGELCLYDRKKELSFSLEKTDLSRKDIQRISLREGTIEGLDAQAYGVTDDSYPYLEILLTDNAANRIGTEKMKDWKNLSVGQDLSLSRGCYMPAVLQEDGRTLLVLNNDLEGKFLETALYIYQNKPLADCFSYEIRKSIKWEDPADAFVAGENQCREEELTGKTVTVYYSSFNMTDRKSGDWVDVCTVMKSRLDQLGIPYAVGIIDEEESLGFAFKTDPSRMSRELMDIMGSSKSSAELRLGLKTQAVHNATAEILDNEDGTYSFRLDFSASSYGMEKLKEFFKNATEKQELLLCMADYPVFSTSYDGSMMDGIITFDNLYFNYHAELEDEYLWVARLMEKWFEGSITLFYDDHEFDIDDDGSKASSADFSLHYHEVERKVARAVEKHAVDARVGADGTALKIFLDLDVDDSLPQTAAKVVKEIYNSMDFENINYSDAYFFLIDENESQGERARIFFSKYADSVKVSGVFKNGRVDQYYDLFLYYLRSDPFYYDKVDDFYNTWR